MQSIAKCLLVIGLCICVSTSGTAGEIESETGVTVDQRIELMSIIQLLANYPLVSRLDSEYKDEAKNYFAHCADHAAVVNFKKLSTEGFEFSVVPEAFIALSPPPELGQDHPVKDEVIEAAGGSARYKEFVASIRSFSIDCKFANFYNANRDYYDQLLARVRPTVEATSHSVASYLGRPLGSTIVVLGPLLHDGGFAARHSDASGNVIAYAFVGPVALEDGNIDFGSADRLEPLISHEFAHTVINPLTSRFASNVAASAHNFPALAEAMRKEGYNDWEQVVYESIIRALTARLTTLERGEKAGDEELADQVRRGFIYAPALVQCLKGYERNRSKYRTIADYFPKLLEIFRQPVTLSPDAPDA